jgi:hypothetical protein
MVALISLGHMGRGQVFEFNQKAIYHMAYRQKQTKYSNQDEICCLIIQCNIWISGYQFQNGLDYHEGNE